MFDKLPLNFHREGDSTMEEHQTLKIIKFRKAPRIKTNKELRDREYLTEQEINQLIQAARNHSRNALRDETLITMMFRHGLRVSEAINLKWDHVDFKDSVLHVTRVKNGKDAVHPLSGIELRLLRRLEREPNKQRHLFLSERKCPMSNIRIHSTIKLLGDKSGIDFPIHPHMLRHSCGYYLANKGIDLRAIQMYLGHANIANTVIYTQLNSNAFNGFWKD